MPTRLESYMFDMAKGEHSGYGGFLGAYNLGVWGISVSGQPPYHQGLLGSGNVVHTAPKLNHDEGHAQNFVKFYDTPHLWGFGDDTEKDWSEIATNMAVQSAMADVMASKGWTALANRWRDVVGQSKQLVDVTSLSPPVPKSEIGKKLCDGLYTCLNNWLTVAKATPAKAPPLMIRLMFGNTFKGGGSFWSEFKTAMEAKLAPLCEPIAATEAAVKPVVLYGSDVYKVGNVKPRTFNHSKIVAGDGQYALVGGHNMCEEVSSNEQPVIHDITSEVTGPGALSANLFAASLWLKAAESGSLYIYKLDYGTKKFADVSYDSTKKWAPKNWYSYSLGKQEEVPGVIKNQEWYYPVETLPKAPEADAPAGSVKALAVLGIGRWGDHVTFGQDCSKGLKFKTPIPSAHACQYASDALKRAMIDDPKNTVIRMVQQDLVNAGAFGTYQASDHTICELMGKRLLRDKKGTAMQVVVSTRFTQNSEGLAYSYGDGPREAIERIADTVAGKVQAKPNTKITTLRDELAALKLDAELEDATVHDVPGSTDSSFCTVAPLVFCAAKGATRNRGSYVWPDSSYVKQGMLGGPSYTNPRFQNQADVDQKKFGPGNHSKVMLVSTGEDDATGLVMIGSDNMYPSPLAEFNFVFEGSEAVKAFREQYWDHLWKYSARFGFTVLPDGKVE